MDQAIVQVVPRRWLVLFLLGRDRIRAGILVYLNKLRKADVLMLTNISSAHNRFDSATQGWVDALSRGA